MKKLLVTGSNGFVAGSILRQAASRWDLHGFARDEVNGGTSGVTKHKVDLLDTASVVSQFMAIRPDAVIHTAAMASIDYCQQHQAEATAINVEVTRIIADCCAQTGARLIHCSTDTVFDGAKGLYTEEEETNPVNFYAETKIRAEEIVLNASGKNVVARLALVIGLRSTEKGNSFLSDLIAQWQNGIQIKFAVNEIRTPVDVLTLGAALLELADRPELKGCIHLAGNTRVNRYEMASQIAALLSVPETLMLPTNSNGIAGRAPRPDDVSLNNDKAKRLLITPMLPIAEALQAILKNNK